MKTKINVLIAEHDPIDVELLLDEFKKSGIAYESKVVQKENDYIDALANYNPDIILSDYTFPAFDGPTAFKIRQAMAPNIPFIFLSGTIGEERSIELIKNGVTDYCLKDKLFTLNHKVHRALKESNANRQKLEIEEELKLSEMRLARAQQVAHMGNWEFNFSTNDISWSDEIYRILGLKPDQKRHTIETGLSFVHPGDMGFIAGKIKDSRDSLQEFCATFRIVRNNGDIRHIYAESKLELDQEGVTIGFYGIIHDITEMVVLENKLAEERSRRVKEMTDAVLTAQESERAEIGKELHDNLNQILGATKLYIDLARTDPKLRDMCLAKSSSYILNVIDQIRKISKTMVTPGENAMGLFACIRILRNDLAIIHPLKIIFHAEGIDEEDLGEKLQLNIYRIVQEQLNNILKHAEATSASISISRQGNKIILEISDNGKGYDTSKTGKGVGIRNIMSRAEFLHGSTEITSSVGNGYHLRVELPLDGDVARHEIPGKIKARA